MEKIEPQKGLNNVMLRIKLMEKIEPQGSKIED